MNDQLFIDHIGHDTVVDGCEFCAVRPMLSDIHAAIRTSDTALNIAWSLQDGYGVAGYTPPQGYDWSGIRDSTPETIRKIHAAIAAL